MSLTVVRTGLITKSCPKLGQSELQLWRDPVPRRDLADARTDHTRKWWGPGRAKL